MPVLAPLPQANVRKFYMPSTAELPQEEQGWVDLDISPINAQDFLEMDVSDGTKVRGSVNVLIDRIKDWNFTEADGSPAKINSEGVTRLGMENINYLLAQLPAPEGSKLTAVQKKS